MGPTGPRPSRTSTDAGDPWRCSLLKGTLSRTFSRRETGLDPTSFPSCMGARAADHRHGCRPAAGWPRLRPAGSFTCGRYGKASCLSHQNSTRTARARTLYPEKNEAQHRDSGNGSTRRSSKGLPLLWTSRRFACRSIPGHLLRDPGPTWKRPVQRTRDHSHGPARQHRTHTASVGPRSQSSARSASATTSCCMSTPCVGGMYLPFAKGNSAAGHSPTSTCPVPGAWTQLSMGLPQVGATPAKGGPRRSCTRDGRHGATTRCGSWVGLGPVTR